MAPLGDIGNWDQPNKHGDASMYVAEEGGWCWMPTLIRTMAGKKILDLLANPLIAIIRVWWPFELVLQEPLSPWEPFLTKISFVCTVFTGTNHT